MNIDLNGNTLVSGYFSGIGEDLTNLDASNITSGTVLAAYLPSDVAYLDQAQVWSAAQNYGAQNLSGTNWGIAGSTGAATFNAIQVSGQSPGTLPYYGNGSSIAIWNSINPSNSSGGLLVALPDPYLTPLNMDDESGPDYVATGLGSWQSVFRFPNARKGGDGFYIVVGGDVAADGWFSAGGEIIMVGGSGGSVGDNRNAGSINISGGSATSCFGGSFNAQGGSIAGATGGRVDVSGGGTYPGGTLDLSNGTGKLTLGTGALVADFGNQLLVDGSGANSVAWSDRVLLLSDGNASVDWGLQGLYDSRGKSVDWQNHYLNLYGSIPTVDWGNCVQNDPSGSKSVDWNNRALFDSAGNSVMNWGNYQLTDSYGNVLADWSQSELLVLGASYSQSNNGVQFGASAAQQYGPGIESSDGFLIIYPGIGGMFQLVDGQEDLSIDVGNRQLWSNGSGAISEITTAIDYNNGELINQGGTAVNWAVGQLQDANQPVLDWFAGQLYDSQLGGNVLIDFSTLTMNGALNFGAGIPITAPTSGVGLYINITATGANNTLYAYDAFSADWIALGTGGGGGGSGTVTDFSAGSLSPLFTTSVASATTTPALSFTLSHAAQNSVLAGPASGGAAAPSYQTAPTISGANLSALPTNTSLYPTLDQNTTGTAANLSGTPALPNGTTATTQATGDNSTKLATTAFVAASSIITGTVSQFAMKTVPSGWLACNGTAVSRTTYAGLFAALVMSAGFAPTNFTVTIASPAVFTAVSAHGFNGGELIRLSTTGALPTGLVTTQDYYVIYVSATTFQVSATFGGAAVDTSGTQGGTQSYLQSLYGLGDGSTTFNVPNASNQFIRGLPSTGRTAGTLQLDAMQSHEHVYNTYATSGGQNLAAGGFPYGTNGPNTNTGIPVTDGTNGTPRLAAETRPVNLALLTCIKT